MSARKVALSALASLGVVTVIYLAHAFGYWSFDAGSWGGFGRGMCAFASISAAGMAAIAVLTTQDGRRS